MSEDPASHVDTLKQLRAAFDRSFAMLPGKRQESESLIQIRLAGETFAVRTRQIAGLLKARKTVPLPSRMADLLGIAALRGALVPVYDLAALVGLSHRVSAPAWWMLVPGETPMALAFDAFEGQLAPDGISDLTGGSCEYVEQLVRVDGAVRAVLNIPFLAASIWKRAGIKGAAQEKEL